MLSKSMKKLAVFTYKGSFCYHCGCDLRYHESKHAFHHVDPLTKAHNISDMIFLNMSLSEILAEADKCVLLCSKCHVEVEDYGAIIKKGAEKDCDMESVKALLV